jgi:hypothetical protein
MPNVLTFADFVKALLPDGAFWRPADSVEGLIYVVSRAEEFATSRAGEYVLTRQQSPDGRVGYYQLLIEGIGDNAEAMYDSLDRLAYIRDPAKTDILSDLEREFGVVTDESLSEESRREYLGGVKYARAGTGDLDFLQNALNNAGFAVQVHNNSPAVNPISYYGGGGGILIVNKSSDEDANPVGMTPNEVWNYTFFVGGNVTRAEDGRITDITPVVLNETEQKAMAKIILKHKPLHSWCVAVVTNDDFFTLSSDTTWQTSTTQGFGNDDQTTGGYWFWE